MGGVSISCSIPPPTPNPFPGLQSQAAAADAGARTLRQGCNAMNDKSCTSIRAIGSLWTAGTLLGSRAECRALLVGPCKEGEMTSGYDGYDDVVNLGQDWERWASCVIFSNPLEDGASANMTPRECACSAWAPIESWGAQGCMKGGKTKRLKEDPWRCQRKRVTTAGSLPSRPSPHRGITVLADPWRGRLSDFSLFNIDAPSV